MLDGMTGTTNASGHLDGAEETVKDFWRSRPRRPLRGRKLAGVAAGVGYRYGVDPVVIRVALVAMTLLGGVGVVAYLLAWLLLPGEDDEVSPVESLAGKGRSSMSKGLTVVLCVLLFPVSGWAFGANWFDGGGIIGVAMIVTGLYLLHRSRGHLNRPEPVAYGATSAMGTTAWRAGAPVSDGQATDTWDPLGADPLRWQLAEAAPAPEPPAPVPSPPPPPRRRSKISGITVGAAIVVGGVGAALAENGTPWFTWAHVAGLMLAVVGTGLVLGAFLGGGRGLIGLAIPLAAVGLVLTSVPAENYGGGFGDLNARPQTLAELRPVYERTAGELDVDLRQLPATDAWQSTTVRTGAGDVRVLVPEDADVRYTCTTRAGDVDCFGRRQSGVGTEPLTGRDNGDDGEGGPRYTIVADAGAGQVEVARG